MQTSSQVTNRGIHGAKFSWMLENFSHRAKRAVTQPRIILILWWNAPPSAWDLSIRGRKAQCFLKSARCHLNDLNHMNPQHSTSQRNRMTARVSGASGMKRRWNGLFNRQRARNCRGGGSSPPGTLLCLENGKRRVEVCVWRGWSQSRTTTYDGHVPFRFHTDSAPAQKLPSMSYWHE